MPLAKADSRWLESKIEVKSHVEIGWLKLAAPLNIRVMSLTLDVSQVPTGWLKEVADRPALASAYVLMSELYETLGNHRKAQKLEARDLKRVPIIYGVPKRGTYSCS